MVCLPVSVTLSRKKVTVPGKRMRDSITIVVKMIGRHGCALWVISEACHSSFFIVHKLVFSNVILLVMLVNRNYPSFIMKVIGW